MYNTHTTNFTEILLNSRHFLKCGQWEANKRKYFVSLKVYEHMLRKQYSVSMEGISKYPCRAPNERRCGSPSTGTHIWVMNKTKDWIKVWHHSRPPDLPAANGLSFWQETSVWSSCNGFLNTSAFFPSLRWEHRNLDAHPSGRVETPTSLTRV